MYPSPIKLVKAPRYDGFEYKSTTYISYNQIYNQF